MKTSIQDYLLSGLFISLILAGALGSVVGLSPLSGRVFGDYHVLVDFFLVLLIYGLLSAVVVRLLLKIKPMLPGEYSMDSPEFTYWKLLTIVYRMGEGALSPFTPVFMRPVLQSLYGARIGKDVALGGTIDDPYMVSIGDGVVLGNGSLVSGNVVYNGKFVCGEVKIGPGATVGVNSVILPGVEIGENALLLGGTHVMAGVQIPPGETWRGNPARKWL